MRTCADSLLDLGLTQLKTSYGNEVRAYDLERTLCDMVRGRSIVDVQLDSSCKTICLNGCLNASRFLVGNRFQNQLHLAVESLRGYGCISSGASATKKARFPQLSSLRFSGDCRRRALTLTSASQGTAAGCVDVGLFAMPSSSTWGTGIQCLPADAHYLVTVGVPVTRDPDASPKGYRVYFFGAKCLP